MTPAELDALRIVLDPVSQMGLALALFIIMFSVALGLRIEQFAAIMERPLAYGAGVAGQVVGLPLLTLLLVLVLSPPASIALGMIVVASCPGGNVSNMMTFFGRGHVALSVALTATSSIIAAFLTPSLILLWASLYPPTANLLQRIDFEPLSFLGQTTVLLAVPLLSGMAMARWLPDLATRIQKPGAILGAVLLGLIVLVGTVDAIKLLGRAMPMILPPVLIHSTAAFLMGAALARLIRAHAPTRRTLTFEIGLQNTGLALVILLGQLQGLGGAAAVAVIWGIWHLFAGLALVWVFRRQPIPEQEVLS